jgi:hypothetical protein
MGNQAGLKARQNYSPPLLPQSEFARLHLLRRGIVAGQVVNTTSFQARGALAQVIVAGGTSALMAAGNRVLIGRRAVVSVQGGLSSLITANSLRLNGGRGIVRLKGDIGLLNISVSARFDGARGVVRLNGRTSALMFGLGQRLNGVIGHISLNGAVGEVFTNSAFVGQGTGYGAGHGAGHSAGLSIVVTGKVATLKLSGFGFLSKDRQVIPLRRPNTIKPEVMRTIKPDRSHYTNRTLRA